MVYCLHMNFRFQIGKATETACEFLERAGGQINIMKLMKLCYLLDRLSLDQRGIPVVGGDYLSMRNGPVTSELLDLINAGRLEGEADVCWERSISDRVNHEIKLEQKPERQHLSESELELIESVWQEHGHRDQWQLVEWCHNHCGEWTPLSRGCAPIAVERIAQALGKPPEIVRKLAREAAELNQLDEIFAVA
jgi:uncharacterized phage-associated protein